MGSIDRKVRRNQEKLAYKKFSEDWSRAKRNGLRNDRGELLGQRPTFEQFKIRMQQLEAEFKAKVASQRAQTAATSGEVQPVDLEWQDQ